MTTVQVLRAARARIDTPDKWCQRTNVRVTPDGFAYCSVGAVAWACGALRAGEEARKESNRALARAMSVGPMYVPSFNDSHSHAEVLAAFDTAIRNEEAREQEHNMPASAFELVA